MDEFGGGPHVMPLDQIGGALQAGGERRTRLFRAPKGFRIRRDLEPSPGPGRRPGPFGGRIGEHPHGGQGRKPPRRDDSMEEAHLALLWTVQVRNRVMDAYNEIMRMPL